MSQDTRHGTKTLYDIHVVARHFSFSLTEFYDFDNQYIISFDTFNFNSFAFFFFKRTITRVFWEKEYSRNMNNC